MSSFVESDWKAVVGIALHRVECHEMDDIVGEVSPNARHLSSKVSVNILRIHNSGFISFHFVFFSEMAEEDSPDGELKSRNCL